MRRNLQKKFLKTTSRSIRKESIWSTYDRQCADKVSKWFTFE